MRRKLTYEEVQKLIKYENECGLNDCLQQIFTIEGNKTSEGTLEYFIGVHYDVFAEFDNNNQFGEYEVIDIVSGKNVNEL